MTVTSSCDMSLHSVNFFMQWISALNFTDCAVSNAILDIIHMIGTFPQLVLVADCKVSCFVR